jgi:hypothetical protein
MSTRSFPASISSLLHPDLVLPSILAEFKHNNFKHLFRIEVVRSTMRLKIISDSSWLLNEKATKGRSTFFGAFTVMVKNHSILSPFLADF